jgi:radical SAM superfamily enzyme YgiQ (UPF0313 family)
MRVLLSPAYQLDLDPKQAANREPYPPLGTLYAAARLRRDGHEVALSDSMLANGLDEYQRDLRSFQPELVAVYEDDFNYLSKMCLTNMRDRAFEKGRLAKDVGALVVAHGSDASDHVERYLDASVDVVVLGEGEETLAELARQGSSSPGIHGIAYRGRDRGAVVRTPARAVVRDLDRLPLPAWDLVDVERYRNAWLERHDRFSLNMVTTRGCPFHCNWCAKPIYGQRYSVRSPASVADELDLLRRTARPDHIWFADDIFGLEPGWVSELAREVDSRGSRTPFKIQSRADLIDESVAEALARAGCENVWIGAESGSQKVLDAMEKGIRVEQIGRTTERLRARGIRVSFFLQFGYPGEEWSDIEKTLEMVRRARPDDVGISVSYPLPGTPFFDRVVRDGAAGKTNWTDSDDLDLMFRGTYSKAFYRALYRFVHSDFRLRRELRELPSPTSAARAVRDLGLWIVARTEVEIRSHVRNPALPPT